MSIVDIPYGVWLEVFFNFVCPINLVASFLCSTRKHDVSFLFFCMLFYVFMFFLFLQRDQYLHSFNYFIFKLFLIFWLLLFRFFCKCWVNFTRIKNINIDSFFLRVLVLVKFLSDNDSIQLLASSFYSHFVIRYI